MDTQLVEILGQNWLVNELLKAEIETARPSRDRGIDLIAYLDRSKTASSFVARPIQLKAATKEVFSLDSKYEKTKGLLLVYIWYVQDNSKTIAFALSYKQAFEIAEQKGWTKTNSWKKNNSYSNNQPGKELKDLLKGYQMTNDKWYKVISEV